MWKTLHTERYVCQLSHADPVHAQCSLMLFTPWSGRPCAQEGTCKPICSQLWLTCMQYSAVAHMHAVLPAMNV